MDGGNERRGGGNWPSSLTVPWGGSSTGPSAIRIEGRVARRPRRAASGWAWRGLGVLAAVAPAVWVMRTASLAGVADLVAGAGPALLLVLAPFPLAMAAQAWGWRTILRAVDTSCPYRPLLRAQLASQAVVFTLPAGSIVAEGVKLTLLDRWCGVRLPEATASVGATRFLLLFSHAFYLATGALVAQRAMHDLSTGLIGGPGLEWLGLGSAIVVLLAALGMAGTFALVSPASALGRAARHAPFAWLRRRARSAVETLERTDGHLRELFRRPGPWLVASGPLFLASWASGCIETALVLHGLGIRVPFADVLALETLLTLARALALFTPAGLGLQDAGYTMFLGACGVPGAATIGLAFSVIKRAKEVVWILIGYALLLRWRPANGKR